MAIVSITRLRVRSWRYLPSFLLYAMRSQRQAKRAAGVLRVSLLAEAHKTFWTRTIWTDETSMKRFMLAGAHRQVMPKLLEWCDEASVVHWEQATDAEPSWLEAHRRMQQEGRRSKVNHPSAAQEQFQTEKPKMTREAA